ncbi:TPA: tryptophan synthase subunit alpha [Candidatus Galligastranaerophilus intestinavium]|uniref:Tryptophan synthase alpha chain n=1 Tax=Candidatus Galligastranaerophilus intestinavium TaxID=2840836 RepID=A0A9D1JWX8_9BACT|nr:tryptophan synthase subunit alpha [Candidatus Galligastranaerophilus intestinavium]
MSKLSEAFRNKTLTAFLTAGDPDINSTEDFVMQMVRAGVDIVEISIPFSDPIAENEVVQASTLRALKVGITIDNVFELVESLRKKTDVAIVFLTYLNPIFNYGYELFFQKCNKLGVEGVIIPDLPYEEKEEVQTFAQKYGVDVICILTVEPKERVRKIACCAGGFIYLISPFNSPTSKQEDLQNLKETIKEIKKVTNTPLVLGFGTPSSNDIKIAKELSQGLVVGSKIVRIIAQYGKNASEKIYEYVKTLKDAL